MKTLCATARVNRNFFYHKQHLNSSTNIALRRRGLAQKDCGMFVEVILSRQVNIHRACILRKTGRQHQHFDGADFLGFVTERGRRGGNMRVLKDEEEEGRQ